MTNYTDRSTTTKLFLALACSLLLSACASLSIPQQPSQDYIATLLQNNDFDTALKNINHWQQQQPDSLELPKQRKQITDAISRFETSTLKTTQKLEKDNQWQDAKTAYENALEILPASQSLQNAYSEFSVRRLNYINNLKENLDVAQAKHWLAIRSDIKAVHQAAPDDKEAQAWNKNSEADRERLALRLVEYGLAHEDNQHFGTAALRYDLAYRLNPGDFTKPYHERAAKIFAQRKAKQKKRAKAVEQRQQSKLGQLIKEFNFYLSEAEFQLARQTLGAMEVIDADAPEVIERRNQLTHRRNVALNQAILEGKKLYTKGEFDNAIRVWKGALELDPDSKELKENIQRAVTFRENIERLKSP